MKRLNPYDLVAVRKASPSNQRLIAKRKAQKIARSSHLHRVFVGPRLEPFDQAAWDEYRTRMEHKSRCRYLADFAWGEADPEFVSQVYKYATAYEKARRDTEGRRGSR